MKGISTLFTLHNHCVICLAIHIKSNNFNLQQILKQDEEFFLTFDLSGTVLEDLNCLKDVWKQASPATKTAIWKYVKILLVLSQKYKQ